MKRACMGREISYTVFWRRAISNIARLQAAMKVGVKKDRALHACAYRAPNQKQPGNCRVERRRHCGQQRRILSSLKERLQAFAKISVYLHLNCLISLSTLLRHISSAGTCDPAFPVAGIKFSQWPRSHAQTVSLKTDSRSLPFVKHIWLFFTADIPMLSLNRNLSYGPGALLVYTNAHASSGF
jgi:hypothetical protein